jgi:hypothetical protein
MEEKIENKYVAFCDILGFSNSVINEFDKVIAIYKDFRNEIDKYDFFKLKISIYSDSILIMSDDIIEITKAVQILLWRALSYGWIIRGGIAYGKHWKESDENNLFIVSEALVKAVNIEKTIKHPIIVISDEIDLGLEYWQLGFEYSVFDLPIINYNNQNIVNPFNNYWFKSAEIKLNELKNIYVSHSHKYEYLLEIIEAIKTNQEFIPQSIIDYLLEQKVIEEKK